MTEIIRMNVNIDTSRLLYPCTAKRSCLKAFSLKIVNISIFVFSSSLLRNPVTNKKHYRLYVINKLPQIRVLDFQKVKLKVGYDDDDDEEKALSSMWKARL